MLTKYVEDKITIKDISTTSFEIMLRFIYGYKVNDYEIIPLLEMIVYFQAKDMDQDMISDLIGCLSYKTVKDNESSI